LSALLPLPDVEGVLSLRLRSVSVTIIYETDLPGTREAL